MLFNPVNNITTTTTTTNIILHKCYKCIYRRFGMLHFLSMLIKNAIIDKFLIDPLLNEGSFKSTTKSAYSYIRPSRQNFKKSLTLT